MESEASSLAKIVRKNLVEFPSLSKGLWRRREIVPLGGLDTLWGEDKVGEGFGTWGKQQLSRSTWVKSNVLIHVLKGVSVLSPII